MEIALKDLDARVEAERERRVTLLQRITARAPLHELDGINHSATSDINADTTTASEVGGISKNDVILSWQLLHRPSEGNLMV